MIEVELKRIADALEKLVVLIGNPMRTVPAAAPAAAGNNRRETEELNTKTEPAPAVTGEVKTVRSRADIKQALDNLGISYNDRLRTENLEAMLIEAEKNGGSAKPAVAAGQPAAAAEPAAKAPAKAAAPVPADVQSDFFGDSAPAPAKPAAKVYTVNEGIELAKRLAAKFGPDKAVSIIQSYGAQTVTQIAEKGKLQEFCAEVLKKEKDYEAKK